MIGALVSHYRIIDSLGSGGMGEVYAAEDLHLGRRVAIKFPAPRDDLGEYVLRFRREARAASRLTHPNIARVYDYGEGPDGRPFLVMELVSGISLRDKLRQGRLEPPQTTAIVAGILRALGEAHANGLVHRDIKPANVMINSEGEVKVLDFGLAKEIRTNAVGVDCHPSEMETITDVWHTAQGVIAGTPSYMSPEQARGGLVDARSDLFSTGALLYHCLTGIPPFTGSGKHEILKNVVNMDPIPPTLLAPGLSKAWEPVVSRALQKDPAARYESAAEMLSGLPTIETSRERSFARIVAAMVSGSKLRATSTGLILLTLVLVVILFIRGIPQHRPPPEAAQYYQRGAMALRDGTYYAAARLLQKAVDLDRDFALAHARLAEAASELDDGARAGSEMVAALPRGNGAAPQGIPGMYIDAIHRTLARDFSGASQTYQLLVKRTSDNDRAAALVDLGRVYEKNNEIDKALAAYRDAESQDPANAAAPLHLGVLLGRRRDPQYSAKLDRAFALYEALSNTEGQAEVLYQRGLLLSSVDPASARSALRKSLEIARIIPSEQQEIAATLQLSLVAYGSGELDAAGSLAAEGVRRAQLAGMNYLAARGLADLGQTKLGKLDYAGAEASFRQSLDLSRRYRMRRTEARALFYLANVHQMGGPEQAALDEIAPALAYFRGAGFSIEAVQCLLVAARVHRDLGHAEEAAASFEEALNSARAVSDSNRALLAEQGLASVLLTNGKWPEALAHYQNFQRSAQSLADLDNTVRGLTGVAGVSWRLGKYSAAEKVLDEAGPMIKRVSPQTRPGFEVRIQMTKAEMALSSLRNANAALLARGVINASATPPAIAHLARCVEGMAMARMGQSSAGNRLCEGAVRHLQASGDRSTTVDAQVMLAEIQLANGHDLDAEQTIEQVIGWASQVNDRELGWRASAIRARVLRHRRDGAGARLAAERAAQLFRELGWDAEAVRGYQGRPDISLLRRELEAEQGKQNHE
jgi:serine/threonine protein kinase/tetratricopeptide (TPR) repeat protein